MADGLQDAPRHAGQVVRRVLLRRNIAVDAETAQLVADAVQAALRAGTPSRPPRRAPACSPRRLRPSVLTGQARASRRRPQAALNRSDPATSTGLRQHHRVVDRICIAEPCGGWP